MPNQFGTKTAADLDLSHIPGIENAGIDFGRPAATQGDGGEEPGSGGSSALSEPSEPADYSAYTGTASAEAGSQESGAAEPATVSPDAQPDLWEPLLAQVPEPLHAELRPTLDEYQRQLMRRDEQLERLTPFQEWVERGLTPQDIVMALQTQQQILQDPRSYWQQLGERYGWNQPQIVYAQPPAAPNQQPQRSEFDDIFGETQGQPQGQPQGQAQIPPELQHLFQEVQQSRAEIQAFQERQRQAEVIQQGRARIDQELNQLEQRYGAFDREEVMRRAFANGQTGGTPSLTEAFHQLKDYENQVARRYAAQRPQAPAVIGGGNGMTPPVKADLSTPEARANAAFQLALQLGADDPNGGYRK